MRPKTIINAGSLFLTVVAFSTTALAAEPWTGDRWRADVDEVRDGYHRHTTLLGLETQSERGTIVGVICTVTNTTTGSTETFRATAGAQTRQDDWEGNAGALGSFGSHTGDVLRWFDPTPCAAGRMTWQKR